MDASSFADDHNDASLALHAQLREGRGNLVFSPFSIRAALGMTFAGARGETATQMSTALRFGSDSLHVAVGEIIARLSDAGGGAYEMAVANSLWGQEGAPVEAAFLELLNGHYDANLTLVDFQRAAESARVQINDWVADKTKRKIGELIPAGGLNELTRLVIANAVYFKGIWELKFEKDMTHDQPFHLEGGRRVQAPLMHQQASFRYLQDNDFTAVDLEYQGDDVSMLVLLPHKRDGLRDLEAKLSARMLRSCATRMRKREVIVTLPKFRLKVGANLNGPLVTLGMPLAFDGGRADFSGINGRTAPEEHSLAISQVFHQAFVEVNEEGTEAAASLAVGMVTLGTPSRLTSFRADHPFLFAIRDKTSGAIVFLGRVLDPTRED